MKLRYLFSSLLASVLLLAGCVQEPIGQLDELKLSNTYLSIPQDGGQVEVTLTATGDWTFVESEIWPRVIAYKKDADGKKIKDDTNKFGYAIDEEKTLPSWLTLEEGPMGGGAGEYKFVFSADKALDGRSIEIAIESGNQMQYLRVCQGNAVVSEATCKEVIEGPDGKTYRVTGVCTSITNDLYGNWNLNDGTGEIVVYGTLDKDGAAKNFVSWGMEAGDVVTVEGPKLTYGSTVELVDVTVIEIKKSLVKITETPESLPKEGGVFTVGLEYKGDGVQPSIAEDCREWVSIVEVKTRPGEPTKLDPNPASIAEVTFKLAANEAGTREGKIVFTSSKGDASSSVDYAFAQEGSIAEVTVAEFLEKEVGSALYKLTGKVSGLKASEYGNFHLVDATGSVYVYGLTATPVEKNDKSFPTLGIKEGDIVTLIGTRARYNDAKVPEEKEQVGGPAYYVSHIGHTEVTVAAFLAKETNKEVWYKLTGKVTGLKTGDYGNFHLVDETGSVYVFGLTKAPVAKNDKTFPTLGVKEGDIVTLIGTRDRYNDAKVPEEKEQVGGPAYYISHVAGEGGEGGEEPETPGTKTERNLAFSAATASATLGQDFTAPTLSGETDGVEYSSSNTAVATVDAATGAVTLVAAGETTITATAAETETLLAGTASYTLTVSAAEVVEPEFEAGKYWIVANNLVAKPVTSSFGYLNVEDAWKSASSVASTQANAFTFTSVEGGYTIQDEAGKYYYGTVYNDAWSKNFNVSATLPAEGAIWKIVKNDDDTYTITNTTQPSYLQYSVSHGSFGHYTTAQSNAVLPTLVKVENAVPAVTLESSLTFEAEGGSQTITLPEGVSAVPSCDNAAFTATASANVVTVSTAATTEAQSGVLTLVLNYNGFAITKTVDLTQKAAPVAGETVVLHETFDKCQYGSSFANNAANGSDTSIKTDVSGWTFVKGYEAYKSAKFGGGSAAGSATTPKLGVSGDMTVTFVATPWANDKTTLKLSVVGGGELNVSTVTMKTSFSEHTVTITGATAETQLKFESNAISKCRFFLDDVKIVKN